MKDPEGHPFYPLSKVCGICCPEKEEEADFDWFSLREDLVWTIMTYKNVLAKYDGIEVYDDYVKGIKRIIPEFEKLLEEWSIHLGE